MAKLRIKVKSSTYTNSNNAALSEQVVPVLSEGSCYRSKNGDLEIIKRPDLPHGQKLSTT